MKILVVGSGGREHALCWRLAAAGHELLCAPGNPGIGQLAERVDLSSDDHDALAALALGRKVDLVVIGPEAPLVAGLADRMRNRGLTVFGPSSAAARLEGSKSFAKEFFGRHGIRTAEFRVCSDMVSVDRAIAELSTDGRAEVVVKADGLAAGKGVILCNETREARAAARAMLDERRFGSAGSLVVIERRLRGREVSILALCDGKRVAVLPPVEDHKAIFDGDQGPNTGGMGTASPPAWVDDALLARVRAEILDPTVRGLQAEGIDYRGVLYAGILVDAAGAPWILEYNVRFGDPETQPIAVRFDADLGAWLHGAASGALPEGDPPALARAAVCVVLAASGYPGEASIGDPIEGAAPTGAAEAGGPGGDAATGADEAILFHAGTTMVGDRLVTAGGRVLGVTALGDGIEDARERAYRAVAKVSFDGMQYRRDIGARGIPGRRAP